MAGRNLAVAQVQVGPAHPAGGHAQQHLPRPGHRLRDVREPQRAARRVEQHRAHRATLNRYGRK